MLLSTIIQSIQPTLPNLATVATLTLAHESTLRSRTGWETDDGQLDTTMYTNGTQVSVIPKRSLMSLPNTNTTPIDSEYDILLELEAKRRQLDEEVANFREQKDKEFRDFEKELRASRKRKSSFSSSMGEKQRYGSSKPPSRTSSSSALNLLAGRGTLKQPQPNSLPKTKTETSTLKRTSSQAEPSVCQPVVSIEKLNVKGQNAPPPSPKKLDSSPMSESLTRTLSQSSSTSSIHTPIPSSKQSMPSPTSETSSKPSSDEGKHQNTFSGLFTPSYITLIDQKSDANNYSSSALETPPAEEESATAPSSWKSNPLGEALPITSSSYPPRIVMSPGGHVYASKRAYTAPTVSSKRIPSALRTASGGAMDRKRKHVTFRLADSAIVEPSSSYEEGPSPQLEDGDSEKGEKSPSGHRSPLRMSKSQLHRVLSPDEEDAEAGVMPGMGMGEVIQKLNDYTVSEAAKHGENLVLEVDENQKLEDDVEDDDEGDDEEDLPMVLSSRHQDHVEDDSDRHFDVNYHEHEDEDEDDDTEDEEDGYFSPKAKHVSTMSPLPRGNSPLAPYRDEHWAELSSSDKDRLLFEARRLSDEGEEARQRNSDKIASQKFNETGFTGGLKQNDDGGSGVGFFELDEELASPDSRQATPFEFDNDADDVDTVDHDNEEMNLTKPTGLGLSTPATNEEVMAGQKHKWEGGPTTPKFGVGSVPIDIVRPSMSVSSSWVGTFGH